MKSFEKGNWKVNQKIFQFETLHYVMSENLKGKKDLLGTEDKDK